MTPRPPNAADWAGEALDSCHGQQVTGEEHGPRIARASGDVRLGPALGHHPPDLFLLKLTFRPISNDNEGNNRPRGHMLTRTGIQIIDGQRFMGGRLRLRINERNVGFMSFPTSRTMGSVE